jgi:AhpD family alkylhydroperoxidase
VKEAAMPLIPYADPDAMPPEARKEFDALSRKLNIFRMLANAPEALGPMLRLGEAILTQQKLDKALRELIILAAARLEGGLYEWVQHVPIARRAGCTDEQIAALEALSFDAACFDARAKAMLRLVRETVQNVKAGEAAVAAAKVQFAAQEIVEIMLTTGFYMMVARLTETTRVEIDGAPDVPVPSWGKVSAS